MSQLAELNPHPSSVMSRLTCCKCKRSICNQCSRILLKMWLKTIRIIRFSHPKWMLYPVSSNTGKSHIRSSNASMIFPASGSSKALPQLGPGTRHGSRHGCVAAPGASRCSHRAPLSHCSCSAQTPPGVDFVE